MATAIRDHAHIATHITYYVKCLPGWKEVPCGVVAHVVWPALRVHSLLLAVERWNGEERKERNMTDNGKLGFGE